MARFSLLGFYIIKCHSEYVSNNQRPDGHLVFSIGPKNANLVEDIEILLPVKFRCILLTGFRIEIENVSAIRDRGGHFVFSNLPGKHKLGRGR